MKKRVLFLVMGICLLVLIGGCKKKDITDNIGSDNSTNNISPTAAPAPVKEAYVASDYITLGQYKGVKVTVTKTEVTDGIVDAAINEDLKKNATVEPVTDRAVQNGDTVNIDFKGLKDGVAFDGGSGTGVDLEIGSGTFIPGFEEGIIGAKTGDKVTVNVTFPKDYQATDLAGKPVVFNVTVNSISKAVTPELTDAYVKTNTNYESVQAYKDAKRAQLQETSDQNMQNEKRNNVMQAVIDGSTFSSVPQNLIDYYAYNVRSYNEQMINYYYGTTVADYLKSVGKTQADFDSMIQEVALNQAKAELAEKAIAEAESLKISDSEYKDLLPQYLTDNGIESEDVLRQYETKEQTMENMLFRKAIDLAVSQAVVTEKTSDELPTPTVAP
jgi:trigger factor